MRASKPFRMRSPWMLAGLLTVGLALPAAADPLQADQVGVMAGDAVGLVQIELGSAEHPARVSLAFVGEPAVVDGVTVEGPAVRLGVVDRDGTETYETRILEASAFARLGSSWYLDLEIPDLGTVTIKLTETTPANMQLALGTATSTGRDSGQQLEALGHRHDAVLAGDPSAASVSVLFRGFELKLDRASATLGEHGAIVTRPAGACIGDLTQPSGRSCLS